MSATVSAGEATLKVVAWATLFAGTGMVVGNLIDQIIGGALRKKTSNNVILFIGQFAVGVASLGSMVEFLIPENVQSPISDGLLFFFFLQQQPQLLAAATSLMSDLNAWLFPTQALAKVKPAKARAQAQPEASKTMSNAAAVSQVVATEEQDNSEMPALVTRYYDPIGTVDFATQMPAQPF